MTFPSISINSNHIPQLQFQDKTTSNSNNHSSTLPISVKLETEHPNHHRNNDNNSLLQTSANSKKALENLLEAIRHTMFSYSIQSSSLSTPYLSSMPFLFVSVVMLVSLYCLSPSTYCLILIFRLLLYILGVDWKSLIVPACLPVDTDYFPDTCRLRSEWYTLHDYRVVPSGMSPDEWASMNNE
ncbi:dep domain containing protein, putative [Schistosoma mansoni]|uniref:dep domain containing protein, putative n=1 Tax=Schistosoma mansoni TaxID=6183 RepID=UPI00022C8299|nr:dep domain containing protein, putative [Schistosoma mansoni]|eukprot:XP_018644434.1 dep domain containing protein, putative [Schistosoma mansoni]